jgi:hypothetical protein
MKNFIVISLVLGTLSGCANVTKAYTDQFRSSTDLAMESCEKIGLQKGTRDFQQCVISRANNINQARSAQAARSAAFHRDQMNQLQDDMDRRRIQQQCYIDNNYIYCR